MSTRRAVAHILVRIPLVTVVIEEAVFRGVLHGALVALYPQPVAIWLGATLFGLWHIGPGLDQAHAVDRRKVARLLHVIVTVVATTAAGAFLVWLRVETGSIWVPVAVHAGVNMTLAIFARLATIPAPQPALAVD
jgi:membrane protease YdiL (CAAX protease family)